MMAIRSFFFHLYLVVVRRTRFVGRDVMGNRYFETRHRAKKDRMRFVVYGTIHDASAVAPDWHGWLHYSTDEHPQHTAFRRFAWQKAPLPNLTGTVFAYRPKGHFLSGGARAKATGDYVPWQPKNGDK